VERAALRPVPLPLKIKATVISNEVRNLPAKLQSYSEISPFPLVANIISTLVAYLCFKAELKKEP
jgi:hypothetical protein